MKYIKETSDSDVLLLEMKIHIRIIHQTAATLMIDHKMVWRNSRGGLIIGESDVEKQIFQSKSRYDVVPLVLERLSASEESSDFVRFALIYSTMQIHSVIAKLIYHVDHYNHFRAILKKVVSERESEIPKQLESKADLWRKAGIELEADIVAFSHKLGTVEDFNTFKELIERVRNRAAIEANTNH